MLRRIAKFIICLLVIVVVRVISGADGVEFSEALEAGVELFELG